MNEDLKEEKLRKKQLRKQKREFMRMQQKASGIKHSTVKNWIKEIKRIIWPKSSKSWRWFGITIVFLVIMAIFCFLITLGFTGLWNALGIKV
ncbi:preprotein translocase subunit SecE [Mycoplasma phocoeninasale]|uniref:Preprotein translocase subunit SecE n=1 Tax=Mycoplasma phocoeninasale TaxID=2726117 RepID=A0A858U1Y3_9MOLU|nr:preprotein translocase subunit SecE [Mycoplasma phocoeninasale]MBN0970403.1 preprotein translocase subunit SecE [Mycoplasma phocoeninasale]QJG66470.1 preprotein translocase subunit SecE [Mycoplasma phocoeninasale]